MDDQPYVTGQLFEYECWWCHSVVGGTANVAPRGPCPYCGVAWGYEWGPRVIEVGPAGAHSPETPPVFTSLERLLAVIETVFEDIEEG